MAILPRSFRQWCQYALLAITTIAFGAGTSLGGPGCTTPPLYAASRTYPSVASGCACAVAPVAARWFARVLIIVLENQDYKDAIADRYLGQLAKQGAHFTIFHGLFHSSYPNYLAMVAGKAIPTRGNRQRDLNECSIADLLTAKGLTWKNYAEGYPTQIDARAYPDRCVKDNYIGRYARKHVPFMSFIPIQQHACGNIVAASRFADDLKTKALPTYAFYSPNMDNDGHDAGLPHASQWLAGFLEPLRKSQAFMKDTLIVVTFDESSSRRDNHIYTIFLGPMVQPKEVTAYYTHYNVLRTIEENFGLCPLGEGDSGAKPITTVWKGAVK